MFDTLPPDASVRAGIEKEIIEGTDKAIKYWMDAQSFGGESLSQVLEAWYLLERYYEQHVDFAISIEVIRDYRRLSDSLRYCRNKQTDDADIRVELFEAITELENYLEAIIAAVNRRVQPDG